MLSRRAAARFSLWLDVPPTRSNRIDDENAENNSDRRPSSHEHNTLRGPPLDNRADTLNTNEWRNDTSENDESTENP